jgi:DNA primase catalytic core
MYSEDFIAKVKAGVDLAEVVGETVQLRRSGKYLTGLSPFTKEKTPSFFVNPERQTFHCYSSDTGGDVFEFVRLTKGLSFPEAVTFVANRAGIPLEETNKSPEQQERERRLAQERKTMLALNRYAARFYQEQFEGPAGAAARDYAHKRGILPESILSFAIGLAPDSWTALRDCFLKIQAPMVKAYELGLFRTKGGEPPKADGSNLFDTFRNRLVFPIRDPQGEVLGFGGRWLGPSNPEVPKYLNSPESSVYEKDKILYNLDQAKKSIREMDTVVLVEGYMDCLALVQAGFPNVVANCGTALTRTQAGILRKSASKVICLYDSDNAGQAAMEKAMNLFLDTDGFPLLGAHLPGGKDPDEFLRTQGEMGRLKMAEILQNSPALIDEWIDKQVAECPKTLQGRADALNKIAAKLSKLRDDVAIQARFPGLAKALDMETSLLQDAVRKYKKGFLGGRAAEDARQGETMRRNLRGPADARASGFPSGHARSLPSKNPAHIQKDRQIQATNGKRDFSFQRRFFSDLLRHPIWIESLRQKQQQDPGVVLAFVDEGGIQQALSKILEPLQPQETDAERINGLLSVFREQPEIRNLISEATMGQDGNLPAKDLEGALRRLREESLKKRAGELQRQIDEAEKRGDSNTSDRLLMELTELRRQRAQN